VAMPAMRINKAVRSPSMYIARNEILSAKTGSVRSDSVIPFHAGHCGDLNRGSGRNETFTALQFRPPGCSPTAFRSRMVATSKEDP
jgi:hypothetical protein